MSKFRKYLNIKYYDWKYINQAWYEELGRGGLSIHALATICGRKPEKILHEMEADETNGVYMYICGDAWDVAGGGMGLPAFSFDPTSKWFDKDVYEDAKEALRLFPWPEYQGFQHWKGQKKATFASYQGSRGTTLKELRGFAQCYAKGNGEKIVWGKGVRKL